MTAPVDARVVGVELRSVALPLRRAHEAAHGREVVRRVVLVRVRDAAGSEGWGECSTLSQRGYSSEDTAGAWHELRNSLVPALLAGSPLPAGRGPMAGAAAAAALASLDACRAGCSLAALLARERGSGPPAAKVRSTAVIAVDGDIDVLLREVDAAVACGHRGVKVKVRPGWDLAPLRALRSAWPSLWLAADANEAYAGTPEAARALAPFGLAYLEQPLGRDDLGGHAALSRDGDLRVALDEAATSEHALEAIAASRAATAVNVKLSRLGGPREALAAVARAGELGLDAWCGGMLETGVGRAVALAVAAQPGFTLPSDLGASARYFDHDIVDPPATIDVDGAVAVPDGGGLGARVRADVLDAVTERQWSAGDVPG